MTAKNTENKTWGHFLSVIEVTEVRKLRANLLDFYPLFSGRIIFFTAVISPMDMGKLLAFKRQIDEAFSQVPI